MMQTRDCTSPIERHYGTLIGGAHAGIVGRLNAIEAQLEQAAEARES